MEEAVEPVSGQDMSQSIGRNQCQITSIIRRGVVLSGNEGSEQSEREEISPVQLSLLQGDEEQI